MGMTVRRVAPNALEWNPFQITVSQEQKSRGRWISRKTRLHIKSESGGSELNLNRKCIVIISRFCNLTMVSIRSS
jgi:hypothetical protein